MYKFLAKNGQALAFGVGTLITVIFFAIAAGGLEEFSALPIEEQRQTTIFDFGLVASLALTVLSVVLLVVFGVYQVATNFKESALGLVALLVLGGIYFVAMAMAPGRLPPPRHRVPPSPAPRPRARGPASPALRPDRSSPGSRAVGRERPASSVR